MSHVTISKARIQNTEFDLQAVETACKSLGLVLCRNTPTYHWYGRWVNDYHGTDAAYKGGVKPADYGKCTHMIRLAHTPHEEEVYAQHPEQKPYEIGLVQMPDGTFSMIFDSWGGGPGVERLIQTVGGNDCKRLMHAVSQHKIVAQVARQPDHYVKRVEDLGNGKTKVVVGVRGSGGNLGGGLGGGPEDGL